MADEGLVKSLGVLTGFILGLLLVILMFGGCSSVRTEYIPVESMVYRSDTVRHDRLLIERDTVKIRERILEQRKDSVAPILDSLGRVVGMDHWHIIDRSAYLTETNIRLLAEIDSLKSQGIRTETKLEQYPVDRIVETNVLYWWQKILIGVGIVGLVAIGIAVLLWIKR